MHDDDDDDYDDDDYDKSHLLHSFPEPSIAMESASSLQQSNRVIEFPIHDSSTELTWYVDRRNYYVNYYYDMIVIMVWNDNIDELLTSIHEICM